MQVLKTWKYPNVSKGQDKIELSVNQLWIEIASGKYERNIEYVWREKIYGVPPDIMQEIFQAIAQSRDCQENKICKFWKFFQPQLLQEFKETCVINQQSYVIHISRKGVEVENQIYNYKTFDVLSHVFLFGFEQFGVPISIRRKVRTAILESIPKSGLGMADAFPLIDYEKVQKDERKIPNDNGGEDVQILHANGVEIGGWDRGGGGSQTYSLERFLANDWNIQSRCPASFVENIKMAIINEN